MLETNSDPFAVGGRFSIVFLLQRKPERMCFKKKMKRKDAVEMVIYLIVHFINYFKRITIKKGINLEP